VGPRVRQGYVVVLLALATWPTLLWCGAGYVTDRPEPGGGNRQVGSIGHGA